MTETLLANDSRVKPTPFLKWAGGKRALLGRIRSHLPERIDTYYEPFLGAGSLFFSLPEALPKVVSDVNTELISVYKTLRDDVDGVLTELRKMSNTRETYLSVRSWDRFADFGDRPATARAARFIFLNKCGYNGLYRVNSAGQYNVPYGNPEKVDFVAEDNLRAVSDFLKAKAEDGKMATSLSAGDYREILSTAQGTGAFVYLDPPYHPTSPTAGFTGYLPGGFSESDQVSLHNEILRLTALGVRVLMSNSNTQFIRDLYSEEVFTINELNVRRAIAAKTTSRQLTTEILVDNRNGVESR